MKQSGYSSILYKMIFNEQIWNSPFLNTYNIYNQNIKLRNIWILTKWWQKNALIAYIRHIYIKLFTNQLSYYHIFANHQRINVIYYDSRFLNYHYNHHNVIFPLKYRSFHCKEEVVIKSLLYLFNTSLYYLFKGCSIILRGHLLLLSECRYKDISHPRLDDTNTRVFILPTPGCKEGLVVILLIYNSISIKKHRYAILI